MCYDFLHLVTIAVPVDALQADQVIAYESKAGFSWYRKSLCQLAILQFGRKHGSSCPPLEVDISLWTTPYLLTEAIR